MKQLTGDFRGSAANGEPDPVLDHSHVTLPRPGQGVKRQLPPICLLPSALWFDMIRGLLSDVP